MLTSTAALSLASVGFLGYEVINVRGDLERNLTVLAEVVGDNAASTLLFDDADSAESTLAALRAESHIVDAGVYTADGELFATYRRSAATASGRILLRRSPTLVASRDLRRG